MICFSFLFSDFEKRHFCLYKIALQTISWWHSHVYMHYNLNWFISSIFLLSTLVPFLFQSFKNSFIFYFFPLLLCWVWVHCGIYKDSYNVSTISYLNSSLLLLPFIFPSPDSWNRFNRYHFYIYMHVYTFFCTVFTLLHSFPTTFPLPLVPNFPTEQDLFCPPDLWFWRWENRKDRKKNMTFLLAWDTES
jgi:hypothetical protein